jgi:hypothetical protein
LSVRSSQFFQDQFLQVGRGFAAGAVFLVLAVPLEALLKRGFGRHFVLLMPEFVHGIWQQDTRTLL